MEIMSNIITNLLKNIDYTVPIFCIKAMAFITGFFIISTIIANLYIALYSFIFARKYGYRTKFISLFGLVFTKIKNKWVKIIYQPSPLCLYIPTIDSDNIKPDYYLMEKKLSASEKYSKLIISIIIFALTLKPIVAFFNGESLNLTEWFLIGFSTGMIFHSINHILIHNYIYNKLYKGILGYIHDKSKLLIKDESFANLDLKPLEELPYKSPSELEKILYYLFYYYYLLALNKKEGMEKGSHEITNMLWNRKLNLIYYQAYYWLIFYYSEIEIDKEKADVFFRKIEPVICNDEDSNAKRILAYYYYKLYNDSEKAKTLIEEGLSVIDKYAFGADRNLEKELLVKLKNEIETKRLIS